MSFDFRRTAIAIVAGAMAAAFAPQPPLPPSQWAADNFVIPDGEFQGARFNLQVTPYLREPLDHLAGDSAVNEIAVMKSAQSGFTTLLMIAVGHTIDREPCDMLVVQPTDSALTDFNSQKLGRAIDKSAELGRPWGRKVRPQTARSGTASTTYEKKFGSNSLVLAISNSSADLSSKTAKKVFLDEIDRYPDDVDGQGSPIQLAAGRQKQFQEFGTWKRLYISTPTIKGASEIATRYEAGDKRRWHVVCPQCAGKFVFEFGPNFKFNRSFPFKAHYVAPCCGLPIEGFQKNELVRSAEAKGGGWIATEPAPGRYPSYHFEGLSSPFASWDEIAREYVEAADDPQKLKPFYNLTLGLPYEMKGEADHQILMARREDYTRGHIPADALLLTVAADVQMRGIYYEVVAWTADRRSYTIEADYLDGETTDHGAGAFKALSLVYHRTWPDAFGHRRRADEFGIDSGYRTNEVYCFTRAHPGTKALKGLDGWGVPALGVASDVDVDYRGRKIKGGAKLRGVGTWSLKGAVYSYLALDRTADGARLVPPPGYCHFAMWLDENYFRQLTAEYLADETYRGRPRKRWKQRGVDNHFLDCRVYNQALATAYLVSFTADDWAQRAKQFGVPEDMKAPDLFAPREFTAQTELPLQQPVTRGLYGAALSQANKDIGS